MPTLTTAEDLVNNPKVLKYIDAIDSDADAAIDLAKSVISFANRQALFFLHLVVLQSRHHSIGHLLG